MTGRPARFGRVGATREQILSTAERLFAEYGIEAVSHRRISEAAGQCNNFAVSYHFGGKADLLRAIVRQHNDEVERLRAELTAAAGDSADVRDWVTCLVGPVGRHLADLGGPTWFARFAAQITTNPAYREVMQLEVFSSPALVRATDRLNQCVPDMPAAVRAERRGMTRHLMVHVLAERERAFASGTPSWARATDGLIDAIVGIWLAPVSGPA